MEVSYSEVRVKLNGLITGDQGLFVALKMIERETLVRVVRRVVGIKLNGLMTSSKGLSMGPESIEHKAFIRMGDSKARIRLNSPLNGGKCVFVVVEVTKSFTFKIIHSSILR